MLSDDIRAKIDRGVYRGREECSRRERRALRRWRRALRAERKPVVFYGFSINCFQEAQVCAIVNRLEPERVYLGE